jgi:hypothetical protein
MPNDEDKICIKCEHPKSEHVGKGCNHLTDMGPQPHGNPELKMCWCDGFVEDKRGK